MSKLRSLALIPLVLLCFAFGVSTAKADIIVSFAGTSSLGQMVDVEADFNFSTPGVVNIKLFNNLVNQQGVAQNLSALSFALNTGQTSGSPTPNGTAPLLVTITSKTSLPTFTGPAAAGWVLSSTTVNSDPGMKLDDLVGTGHAGPKHTIVGFPGGLGKYSNANGSMFTSSHNPFIYHESDFSINIGGTQPSDVSAVTFWFGTADDADGVTIVRHHGGVVPEPTSLALSGIGSLGLLGFWAAARRKRAAC